MPSISATASGCATARWSQFMNFTSPLTVSAPSGNTLFRAWARERGLQAQLSDPGRIASEMARRLDGLSELRFSLGRERLKLLTTGTRRHHLAEQTVIQAMRSDGMGDPRGA